MLGCSHVDLAPAAAVLLSEFRFPISNPRNAVAWDIV